MLFQLHLAAPLLAIGGALLAAGPADTVLTRVVPLEPEWFVRVGHVLRLAVDVLTLGLVSVLLAIVWKFRNVADTARRLIDRVAGDVSPIAERTRRVAENVEAVSTTVRADLARVSALVARTEQRIDETLARAEARARDLEALLDVAQAEAEHSLVAAASTVAAVREGFAALRDELVGLPPREPDDDEHDEPARPRIRSRDA